MTSFLLWALAAFLGAWCVGAGLCTFVLYQDAYNGPETDDERRDRLKGAAVISSVLWPGLLPAALERRRIERDFASGKRPMWLKRAADERRDRTWQLPAGGEFWADAVTMNEDEPIEIQAGFEDIENHDPSAQVECRARMLAPQAESPSQWLPMRLTTPTVSYSDDGEVADPYFETSLQLRRGKYSVDVRVKTDGTGWHELGELTLIVYGANDL
jgi:hypothetical protein